MKDVLAENLDANLKRAPVGVIAAQVAPIMVRAERERERDCITGLSRRSAAVG